MPARPLPARRLPALTLMAIAVVALSCAGCGRRGGLQPPDAGTADAPSPASARGLPQGVGLGGQAQPDPEAVREGDELAEAATPAGIGGAPLRTSKGAKRGYTIPKQPFILDPIL